MKIARSAFVHFLTQIGTAVLGFVGTLYAARILGESILGHYFLFFAVLLIVYQPTSVGIDAATRKRISEGLELSKFFGASLILKMLLFSASAVLILLFSEQVESYIGGGVSANLLVFVLFFLTITSSLRSVLEGEKRVGTSGFLNFLQNLVRVLTWISLISLGLGVIALIVGYWAGLIVVILAAVVLVSTRPKLPSKGHFKSLLSFSVYSVLGSVRGKALSWTDTIVLGFFVSSGMVGIYEVAWNISDFFMFASFSIGTVLFPNVSELDTKGNKKRIEKVLNDSLIFTGIIVIPGVVGSVILGEEVLSIYGEGFTEGYYFLIILVLGRTLQAYELVLMRICDAMDRPDLTFRAHTVFIIVNLIGNVVLIQSIGVIGAAIATSTSLAISFVLIYRYVSRLVEIKIPTKELFLQAVSAAIMGGVLYSSIQLLSNLQTWRTLALVILGGAVYFGTLLILSDTVRELAFKLKG